MIPSQQTQPRGDAQRVTNTVAHSLRQCIQYCNKRRALALSDAQVEGLVSALSGIIVALPFAAKTPYMPRGDGESLYGRPLTPNEIRCLLGAAHGLSTDQIGKAMNLAMYTCKTHLRNVYRKLGAVNAAHAVALGLKRGVITVEQIEMTSFNE